MVVVPVKTAVTVITHSIILNETSDCSLPPKAFSPAAALEAVATEVFSAVATGEVAAFLAAAYSIS